MMHVLFWYQVYRLLLHDACSVLVSSLSTMLHDACSVLVSSLSTMLHDACSGIKFIDYAA